MKSNFISKSKKRWILRGKGIWNHWKQSGHLIKRKMSSSFNIIRTNCNSNKIWNINTRKSIINCWESSTNTRKWTSASSKKKFLKMREIENNKRTWLCKFKKKIINSSKSALSLKTYVKTKKMRRMSYKVLFRSSITHIWKNASH